MLDGTCMLTAMLTLNYLEDGRLAVFADAPLYALLYALYPSAISPWKYLIPLSLRASERASFC